MRVVYTAPNRAHHYAYATALARAGALEAFVCGFSRFSPRAPIPEIGGLLVRKDHFQNAYLASLRVGMPRSVSARLGYISKYWLDVSSEKYARESDLFVFYNGAGCVTARRLRGTSVRRVVEVVNSHVTSQEGILREEHKRLGLPFQPFYRPDVMRRLAEYDEADFVLAPSQFVERSFIERGFPSDKLLRVRYGFNLPIEEQNADRPQDGVFRVLYVGQVAVRKGLHYLVDAFRTFRHPRKELLIVGPKSNPSGLERTEIPDGVRFLGVLKGEELQNAYRTASVFVLPSVEEGLALVLGEALAAGLPIIATCNSGALDLYQDGVEGWITPIRDSAAICDKLQLLADEPERATEMASRAKERRKHLGGWDVTGQILVDTLKAVNTRYMVS